MSETIRIILLLLSLLAIATLFFFLGYFWNEFQHIKQSLKSTQKER